MTTLRELAEILAKIVATGEQAGERVDLDVPVVWQFQTIEHVRETGIAISKEVWTEFVHDYEAALVSRWSDLFYQWVMAEKDTVVKRMIAQGYPLGIEEDDEEAPNFGTDDEDDEEAPNLGTEEAEALDERECGRPTLYDEWKRATFTQRNSPLILHPVPYCDKTVCHLCCCHPSNRREIFLGRLPVGMPFSATRHGINSP